MNRQTDTQTIMYVDVHVSVCTHAHVCVCVPETCTTLQIMTSHKTTE